MSLLETLTYMLSQPLPAMKQAGWVALITVLGSYSYSILTSYADLVSVLRTSKDGFFSYIYWVAAAPFMLAFLLSQYTATLFYRERVFQDILLWSIARDGDALFRQGIVLCVIAACLFVLSFLLQIRAGRWKRTGWTRWFQHSVLEYAMLVLVLLVSLRILSAGDLPSNWWCGAYLYGCLILVLKCLLFGFNLTCSSAVFIATQKATPAQPEPERWLLQWIRRRYFARMIFSVLLGLYAFLIVWGGLSVGHVEFLPTEGRVALILLSLPFVIPIVLFLPPFFWPKHTACYRSIRAGLPDFIPDLRRLQKELEEGVIDYDGRGYMRHTITLTESFLIDEALHFRIIPREHIAYIQFQGKWRYALLHCINMDTITLPLDDFKGFQRAVQRSLHPISVVERPAVQIRLNP